MGKLIYLVLLVGSISLVACNNSGDTGNTVVKDSIPVKDTLKKDSTVITSDPNSFSDPH